MDDQDYRKGIQRRVYELSTAGKLRQLAALLEEHPELDVDGFEAGLGWRALYHTCREGHADCAQLLIDHKADLNARNKSGCSPLHGSAFCGHTECVKLMVENGADVTWKDLSGVTPLMWAVLRAPLPAVHYLIQQKANIHYRVAEGMHQGRDALYKAMTHEATSRMPGIAFAVLSSNTDAKNVSVKCDVNASMRDAHIETYKHVHGYIDEYHGVINLALSDHVRVDTRVGRGENGIYQEPLERVLEYMGLSMSKNQAVNTSIDGQGGGGVKRALIPGHLPNANHWFDKYQHHSETLQAESEQNKEGEHALSLAPLNVSVDEGVNNTMHAHTRTHSDPLVLFLNADFIDMYADDE
jgi:hypothetical protein